MKILIKTFSLVVLSLYFIFPLFAEKPVDTPLPTGSTNWSIQMILGKGGAKTKLRSDNSTFFHSFRVLFRMKRFGERVTIIGFMENSFLLM